MQDSITPDQWKRIKNVFDQAVELKNPERERFLDSSFADEPPLRERVKLLIIHHDSASEFLEPPVTGAAARLGDVLDAVPTAFAAGDVINGRFRILSLIGKGGMGEVYEAADELGGLRVALKTVRSEMDPDAYLNAQFRREVQIARQITHPNVCRINDLFECEVGTNRQIVFLTMELLEGENLAQYLARHGRIETRDALPLVRDIVAALSAAHEQGIVHRDLKASNVMLVPNKVGGTRAVLTDFGLAIRRDQHGPKASEPLPVAGTPSYMAPEQIHRKNVGFAADIFALGVVMYEMVCGRRPFSESSTLTGAARRADSAVESPGRLVPGLDPRWNRVIMRCLKAEPAQRYPHARELIADLEGNSPKARVTRRALIVAALLTGGGLGGWWWTEDRRERAAQVTSVAVLPFQKLAGDPDTEYFAEGLTDELILMLARMPGLRVTARNSTQGVKDTGDLKAAGKLLGVQAIVTGGVRKEGGRVRVTAHLTNLADGQWLWSGNFDEETKLLPRVRVNISLAIAGALKARIPATQLAGMGGVETDNAEAYRLYLLAKHHASYRTDDGMKLSIDYLDQSIANDPNFAPAHAQLAEEYNILAGHPGCPPETYFQNSEQEAAKAIALDPNSGEAHISLGLSYQRYRWDWPAAEREFREGILLSGGMALAHHRYSGFLSNLGRHEAALREIAIAEALDPFSAPIQTAHGVFLYRARQYDAALRQFESTLLLFPSFAVAFPEMADVYRAKGMWEQALDAYRKADELGGYDHFHAAGEVSALFGAGKREEARAMARELESGFGSKHYSAAAVAYAYRGLGEPDKAFQWFDMAADRREPTLMEIKVDPANDSLRADPRFSKLLERLRL